MKKLVNTAFILGVLGASYLPHNTATASEANIQHALFGHALLRYEDEKHLTNLGNRERVRLIAQGGIKSTWTDNWQSTIRLSTGLKNKQNVPAVTIHRFSEQKQPDNDIYIDQAFIQYSTSAVKVRIGKLPWQLYNVTDTFWDRHLNPYGVSTSYGISSHQTINGAVLLPLDGQKNSVGKMYLAQYKHQHKIDSFTLTFAPWLAIYQGEDGAIFAKRDTQYDHQSLRLSTEIKYNKWQLGFDVGKAFDTPDNDNKQDFSISSELRYGGLKQKGHWLLQLGHSRVERYAVIREFGQNARAAALTTNFTGWDIRWRYKLNSKLWLGTRVSKLKSIVGAPIQSNRFRIEARWAF
ncbi:putative porin [Agaribacter flavus]|uniref:Porin n=1 Tax=Agaribacter flavus TaxID=1902781 RepID=A0ABV7FQI9_9ALTE